MIGKKLAAVAAIALGLTLVAKAGAEPPKATKRAARSKTGPATGLEPKAVDVLKAMSARLAAARTLSFTAVTVYESPSRLGPPLAYTTVSYVTLQRPDKLAVIVPGDGPSSEFYYDGKTVMAYAPAENLVAIAEAPPTIDAMLKAAYDYAAIYFPFTDVIVADPYGDIAARLRTAFYIGQSQVIGGVTTDMVAIEGDGVFGQVWIGAADKLPRMWRAVYTKDPSKLRHEVSLSNWRVDGEVPAEAFTSKRAASANRIGFERPDPYPRAAAKQKQ
jgi:hypothetical protein